MDFWLIGILLGLCALLMALERVGVPLVLQLEFKGDLKRETRFLAQYGQLVCSMLIALVVWQIDASLYLQALGLLLAVGIAGVAAMIIKRLTGRVRPGRDDAGKFHGFTWKHINARESFPSSHSASAVACSLCLVFMFPQAAITWWCLALFCALLRYFQDAHWPSDIAGGIALGYASAHVAWMVLGLTAATA